MIIVKMMGNLGNQMFIYAMARKLSLEYNDGLIIDLSGLKRYYYTANYKLESFKLPSNISYDLKELPLSVRLKYFVETNVFFLQHAFYRKTRKDLLIPKRIIDGWYKKGNFFSTNRSFFDFSKKVDKKYKFVYGYFQSEKYFNIYEDTIRQELRVDVSISKQDEQLIKEMANCNSVAVSIRASKIPENSKIQANIKIGFISKEYYYEGMKKIAQKVDKPVFYIFADDIEVVKKEFSFPYHVKYVNPSNSKATSIDGIGHMGNKSGLEELPEVIDIICK